MYLMPKQLAPLLFAGTAGLFFAVVNAVKLVPYYALGQFSSTNLLYSLVLVPLAPLGVWLGHFLVRRSPAGFYYGVISFFLVVIGAKLLWEGLSAMFVYTVPGQACADLSQRSLPDREMHHGCNCIRETRPPGVDNTEPPAGGQHAQR